MSRAGLDAFIKKLFSAGVSFLVAVTFFRLTFMLLLLLIPVESYLPQTAVWILSVTWLLACIACALGLFVKLYRHLNELLRDVELPFKLL